MVSSSGSRRRRGAESWGSRTKRWTTLAWLVTATLGTAIAGTSLSGCAVQEPDLARWQKTQGGPKRLSAVVLFDKYAMDLRVQAAMALVQMKPRKGQHVGIERLVKGTLVCDNEYLKGKGGEACEKSTLDPERRAEIIAQMVPLLVEELKKEPPKPTQGGKPPIDPSFAYKDAAYLMLTYEKTQVITDQALRKQLEEALTGWAMADFERRLNDQAQAFGMEQLLRHIGPSAVKGLPAMMVKNSRSLAQMADLISKIGSKPIKEEASAQLVKIASYVSSEDWKKEYIPKVQEANRKSNYKLTKEQFTEQLTKYQSESLTRVFASMKKVGGEAVVAWALAHAADNKKPKDLPDEEFAKRRALGLAAIAGHIDRKNKKHIEVLFQIVNDKKVPPAVTDQAFARIRELPREAVIKQLFKLFRTPDWRRRRLAAVTILKISKVEHIKEFLSNLEAKEAKNFDPNEAITYGAYFAELKEGDPLKVLEPYMKSGDARVRIAALSYWRAIGDKTMLDKVKAFEDDTQPAPKCEVKEDEAFECSWECFVDKKKKKVTTVGEYVSFCMKPKMASREPKNKDGSKKTAPKDDKKGG